MVSKDSMNEYLLEKVHDVRLNGLASDSVRFITRVMKTDEDVLKKEILEGTEQFRQFAINLAVEVLGKNLDSCGYAGVLAQVCDRWGIGYGVYTYKSSESDNFPNSVCVKIGGRVYEYPSNAKHNAEELVYNKVEEN